MSNDVSPAGQRTARKVREGLVVSDKMDQQKGQKDSESTPPTNAEHPSKNEHAIQIQRRTPIREAKGRS